MISFQDDHSRFITRSVKIWSPTGENAILLLEKVVKRYGVPEQILTDQGTQFKPARGGTSEFARHLQDMGIEHITASKRRPTTIGKIEAFHKAYEAESHLFNRHWSFIRYSHERRYSSASDPFFTRSQHSTALYQVFLAFPHNASRWHYHKPHGELT
jgi:transposase InsO family protein